MTLFCRVCQRAICSITAEGSRDFMDPPDFPFTQRGKQVNLDFCLTTIGIRDRHNMPVSQKFVMTGYVRHGKGDRADL